MKFKIFRYKTVVSTNNSAIRIIKNSNTDYGMIIANKQKNGRGQYGKKWISYTGNLFVSFFYKLNNINVPLKQITEINCLLVKKLLSIYYKNKITLKKPNDLLINKKKICGILQEKIEKSKKSYLIVGIGFNLVKNPNIANYPSTNLLKITNQKINRKKFINELKITFEKFLSKYYKTN